MGDFLIFNRPVLRIPSLAIHLDRGVREGFTFNTELQLNPVIATSSTDSQVHKAATEPEKAVHHRALTDLLQPDSKSGQGTRRFYLFIYNFVLCRYG